MKDYIVSLSERALLLSGALAIFTTCGDGNLKDIYKGNSSGKYVSNVNWADAANKSAGTYVRYFYENASGWDTFCGSIYWEKPSTPETGELANTGSNDGWSRGCALDIIIDVYIRHANNLGYQAHLHEDIMKSFLSAFDDWNEYCGYGDKDFWDSFYDDMERMALSCLQVYELTGDQGYYSALMKVWNHTRGAKNSYEGVGGMTRKTGAPTSRMSCSNGPGCLLVVKLYQLTTKEVKDGWEEQTAYYLNFAREICDWMTAHLCDISTGRVYDNLSIRDDGTLRDPSKVALSHSQGAFMATALKLYNATGEDKYPRNAVASDSYQVNKKMDSNCPVFSGKGNSEDNLLFRGTLVRYFLDMVEQLASNPYPEKTKNKFITASRSCSDVLWTLVHPEGYYVWEYDWAKAPTLDNRDNREDRLTVSLNVEVPGATMIGIRVRYESWVQGKATEKANWVGPDFGKKTKE